MVPKLTEFEAKEAARIILGVPRPNADALVAINCAWDMGYRLPATMAAMARQMLTPPNGRFASSGNMGEEAACTKLEKHGGGHLGIRRRASSGRGD